MSSASPDASPRPSAATAPRIAVQQGSLQTLKTYLDDAYGEDPQDVDGINCRIDELETLFGFWYTGGGLECQSCWRNGKRGVVYQQATSAERHADDHGARRSFDPRRSPEHGK